MTDPSQSRVPFSSQQAIPALGQQAVDYWIDGWQRTILFWFGLPDETFRPAATVNG